MEDNKNYPSFLSNSPCGEDHFEGKSQQIIAENICRILRNDKNCNIIGIDGGWGSGKSNLVKQVQKMLGENDYHFFIYDAWGHQEDLQRRSFLEELIENLTPFQLSKNDWEEKLKKLLSKSKETRSRRVPKLSIGIIVVALAILLNPIVESIAKNLDSSFWKNIVIAIPILFVLGLFIYYLIEERGTGWKGTLKRAFSRLFLEYQNKLEEETLYEMISEDEPSVRKFRDWMKDISDKLGQAKLVIVYDNMDRLPQKKVQELWASIHVFFCENPYENIKVIVPFDREHIKLAFKSEDIQEKQYGDDFINKTFDVVYRVSPPILSDWKKYFASQWETAFGYTSDINSNNVIQIFDMLSDEVTPRRIIAFINEFVSIKMTVDDSIPDNYIALFILGKNDIAKKPIDEIMQPTYLKGLAYLYSQDEDLPKYISALFYQVRPEKAIEIVFTDRIKKALNENKADELNKMSLIPNFSYILENAITNVSNFENAILALNELPEESLGNNRQSDYAWTCLYKKVKNLPKCQVSDYQLILLGKIQAKDEYLRIVLKELIDDQKFSAVDYYDSIQKIKTVIEDEQLISSELTDKETSVKDFIDFVKKAKGEYAKYKIKTNESELNKHLISMDIPGLKGIDFVPYLIKEYSFTPFTQQLEKLINENAPNNDNATMSALFNRYKELCTDKPLKTKLDDSNVQAMFVKSTDKEDFYYDLIAMRLAKREEFSTSYASSFEPILQSIDETLIANIHERLEYYMDYGSILLGLKTFSVPLYKEVARRLALHPLFRTNCDLS